MIILLFIMPLLCSFFGFGCEEPEMETIYEIKDGVYNFQIRINSTDKSMWNEDDSRIIINDTSWSVNFENSTMRYVDESLNEQADRCNSINGTFMFYPKYGKNLCDLSQEKQKDETVSQEK